MEKGCASHAPHLAPELENLGVPCHDALLVEEKSIKERDILGRLSPTYDVEDHCPFTNYLKKLAADLLADNETIQSIIPSYIDMPRYEIGIDTLKEFAGFDGSNDDDADMMRCILDGYVEVKEVLSKKTSLPTEQYRDWLVTRVGEEREKAKVRADALDPDGAVNELLKSLENKDTA